MHDQIFLVRFVPFRNCFVHFSERRLKDYAHSANSALKLSFNGNRTAYMSCNPNASNVPDNAVGINATYARTLGLTEEASVLITICREIAALTKIYVSPVSQDDWEILEMNAAVIQSTLLNYLNVIYTQQQCIVWVSQSMHLVIKIEYLQPNVEVGRLENFTEIEVTPPGGETVPTPLHTHALKWSNFFKHDVSPEICSNNAILEQRKTVALLKKTGEQCTKNVYRLQRISNTNITLNDAARTILEQPNNVYVRKIHAATAFRTGVCCQLTKLLPPSKLMGDRNDDGKNEMIVMLCIVEDFPGILPSGLFPTLSHFTLFYTASLEKILHLEENHRIYLSSNIPIQRDVADIQIMACNRLQYDNIEKEFKLYILNNNKYHSLLLHTESVVNISAEISCFVKFIPDQVKYMVITANSLRNCKVTVKLNDDNPPPITTDPCSDNGFALNVGDLYTDFLRLSATIQMGVQYLQIGLNLSDVDGKYCGTKYANILITGQLGSGKTTMAKMIAQKVAEVPDVVHVHVVECKSLKGKKVETIHKTLIQIFDNCAYFQPSIIIFDDLDVLCGVPDDLLSTQDVHRWNRMSEMLRELLATYQRQNYIAVIATAPSVHKMNKNLYAARGHHLFGIILQTAILEKTDREMILQFMLAKKGNRSTLRAMDFYGTRTEGYVFQDLVHLADKCIFECIKRQEKDSENEYFINAGDIENALKTTIPISFHNIDLYQTAGRTWNLIGGLHAAKEMLTETVYWPLKYSQIFTSCPIHLQTGILIYGHPGTGKTILVGAAAQHFGLRLISVKGPELLSKYVGASEEAVRNIFQKAQNAKPCILFFDEFDSLAPRRGHDSTGVTDRVVNQFLTQLDGVESLDGVYMLAATSRPDLLDPALIRPGRLGRQVQCPLPNQKDRLSILKALADSMILSDNVNLKQIAKETDGYTGADLQAILYTAQLAAMEETLESTNETNGADCDERKCITTTQRHLSNSLKETRPSLTPSERAKYDLIYAKFQGQSVPALQTTGRKQKITLA